MSFKSDNRTIKDGSTNPSIVIHLYRDPKGLTSTHSGQIHVDLLHLRYLPGFRSLFIASDESGLQREPQTFDCISKVESHLNAYENKKARCELGVDGGGDQQMRELWANIRGTSATAGFKIEHVEGVDRSHWEVLGEDSDITNLYTASLDHDPDVINPSSVRFDRRLLRAQPLTDYFAGSAQSQFSRTGSVSSGQVSALKKRGAPNYFDTSASKRHATADPPWKKDGCGNGGEQEDSNDTEMGDA